MGCCDEGMVGYGMCGVGCDLIGWDIIGYDEIWNMMYHVCYDETG